VLYGKECVAEYEGPLWQQLQHQLQTVFIQREKWMDKFCLFHGWQTHGTHACRLRSKLLQSGCSASVLYEHMLMHPGHAWRKQQQGFVAEQQATNSRGAHTGSREQPGNGKGRRKRREEFEQQQDYAAGAWKGDETASARAAAWEPAAAAEAVSESVAAPMDAAAMQLEYERLRAECERLRTNLDYTRNMLGKAVADNAMLASKRRRV
jgi:hypothetical protein